MVIPEFDFHHAIYPITNEPVLSGQGLIFGFTRCSQFLKLKDTPDYGLTVLVTPKWIMAIPIRNPYIINREEIPVYLDGFAYTGLVQLQTVSDIWPATAGLNKEETGVFQSLMKSGVPYK